MEFGRQNAIQFFTTVNQFIRLSNGFGLIGAEDAVLPFVDAMELIAAAHRRPLTIHCVTCRQLGDDEISLNAVLFSFQARQFDIGAGLLADFLPPSAVRLVAAQLCLVASTMVEADIRLPPRLIKPPIRVLSFGQGPAMLH